MNVQCIKPAGAFLLVICVAITQPVSGAPQTASEGNDTGPIALAPLGTSTNSLRLNFRQASLEMVLNYFSEAAGFTILLETPAKGTVDVWSNQPVTPDEAFNLLSSVLVQNGYAAIRQGRKLTIIHRDEAKTRGIPVHQGSDPQQIPATDEIATQIMPLRFIEAGQLVKDLPTLLPAATVLTANEGANSLVVTGTQSSIRRVAEIIQALDAGAEGFTAIRVYHLKNADPAEMVDVLSELFPDSSRSGTSQSPFQAGGPGGGGGPPGGGGFGPPGGFGGGGPPGAARGSDGQSAGNQRLLKRTKVTAVADSRTSAVIVTAPKELLDQVEDLVAQLDADPAKKQMVAVRRIRNSDPQTIANVLQDLFQKNGTSNSRNNAAQNDPLATRGTTQGQATSAGMRNGLSGGSGIGGSGGLGGTP